MIPIDFQVSRSKVKVKGHVWEGGALVFHKHLYFFKGVCKYESSITRKTTRKRLVKMRLPPCLLYTNFWLSLFWTLLLENRGQFPNKVSVTAGEPVSPRGHM